MRTRTKKAAASLAILLGSVSAPALAADFETSLRLTQSMLMEQTSQLLGINWQGSLSERVFLGISGHTLVSSAKYDDGTKKHTASYYDIGIDSEIRLNPVHIFTPFIRVSAGGGQIGYRSKDDDTYRSSGVNVARVLGGCAVPISERVSLQALAGYRYGKVKSSELDNVKLSSYELSLAVSTAF